MNNNYLSDGNAFENKTLSDKTVRLIAKGSITPAALHASFLDSRITKLELNGNINSWKQYLDNH